MASHRRRSSFLCIGSRSNLSTYLGASRGQLGTRFALLDQFRENRQLLVRGGTGTGKTWHALEQAYRYASASEGRDVLLLFYNLALTSHLERQEAMRKLDQGSVSVMSWESLFIKLAESGGT